MNPAIIVVTFNRPNSLLRLLFSLANSHYPDNEDVDLIISIDYQDSQEHKEVVKIANNFEWTFGKKEIIEHKKNLGLRKHVISCGNLVSRYDSIIMLEDDIYVSPKYYYYAINTLGFYSDKEYIGGISLYKHEKNPNNTRPFQPLYNSFDVHFLQFAQSWGQCWSKSMWLNFIKWYDENSKWDSENINLPRFVLNWPESSWLKYYIKYLSETNKYFVYPYFSFSTNFNDVGTHNKDFANNSYQVYLDIASNNVTRFPELDEAICYDVYFELLNFEKYIPISNINWQSDVCVDLYATKKNFKNNRYWLTTAILPYKVEHKYGLNLRPHDANVILSNQGNDIFLYDTSMFQNAVISKNLKLEIEYDYNISMKKLLMLFKIKLIKRFNL